jgi:predicted lactoylglutathione lyase
MIMIGAKDIAALRRFYEEGLGWAPWRAGGSGSIMYKVGHAVLVFLGEKHLADERGEALAGGSRASLAVFLESQSAVDEAIEKALAAGATLTSPARDRAGSLYSGYFNDPEGNSWEIVWAPKMPMSDTGELILP